MQRNEASNFTFSYFWVQHSRTLAIAITFYFLEKKFDELYGKILRFGFGSWVRDVCCIIFSVRILSKLKNNSEKIFIDQIDIFNQVISDQIFWYIGYIRTPGIMWRNNKRLIKYMGIIWATLRFTSSSLTFYFILLPFFLSPASFWEKSLKHLKFPCKWSTIQQEKEWTAFSLPYF